jgi:hypothetical protein
VEHDSNGRRDVTVVLEKSQVRFSVMVEVGSNHVLRTDACRVGNEARKTPMKKLVTRVTKRLADIPVRLSAKGSEVPLLSRVERSCCVPVVRGKRAVGLN